MRKKFGLVMVVVVLILAVGCTKSSSQEKLKNNTREKNHSENIELSGSDSVLLYYPDKGGNRLLTKTVKLQNVTGNVVCKELIRLGVLESEIRNLSCTSIKEDDKIFLNLDFNAALQKQVDHCEKENEQMLIGALVNSYLSAFPHSTVRITINGQLLQSRYVEIDGFWKKYTDRPKDDVIEKVQFEGREFLVHGKNLISEMGFSTYYNEELFDYAYDSSSNVATFLLKGKLFSDKAYMAVSVCEYPLRETVEGLQLQSTMPLSLSKGVFGKEKLAGFQLRGQQGHLYFYDYCIEKNGKVYLIELKYEGASPEKYLPQLMAMVQQFSILQ